MRQESHRAHAVGDAHHHDALPRQLLAAVERRGRRSARKSSAVDPHHHRQPFIGGLGRSPDVQVEAVLADRRPLLAFGRGASTALHARRAELVGGAHAGPFRGRLRRAPAQVADGRRGKGDAAVDGHAVFVCAFQLACLDGNGGGCRHRSGQGADQAEQQRCGSGALHDDGFLLNKVTADCPAKADCAARVAADRCGYAPRCVLGSRRKLRAVRCRAAAAEWSAWSRACGTPWDRRW